jgi:TonB family protein
VKQLSGTLLATLALGCGGSAPPPNTQGTQAAPPPESEPPVALNPDVPIAYPPALFEQKVEGDVTLRLFVDSTGRLVPESSRVAEPSGYPALDSAALAGSAALRFAPAKRHGIAVATVFLQPVEFRQVGTTRTGVVTPSPQTPPPTAAPVPAPVAAPVRPVPRPRPPPPPRPRPDTTRADTIRADTIRADTTRAPVPDSAPAH